MTDIFNDNDGICCRCGRIIQCCNCCPTTAVAVLRGSIGPRGATGAQGPAGQQGPIGVTGATGATEQVT